jgi:hypothetical protein
MRPVSELERLALMTRRAPDVEDAVLPLESRTAT